MRDPDSEAPLRLPDQDSVRAVREANGAGEFPPSKELLSSVVGRRPTRAGPPTRSAFIGRNTCHDYGSRLGQVPHLRVVYRSRDRLSQFFSAVPSHCLPCSRAAFFAGDDEPCASP